MTIEPKEREPFIPYASLEGISPFLQEVVEKYQARMGFLPNALLFYLHRQEIAAPLWQLNDAVMRHSSSTLDQGLKRKLAAIASKTNGCQYCTTHNCEMLNSPGGFAAEGWDMSDVDLNALLNGHPVAADEFEQICFDFVQQASFSPTEVPDEMLERLKAKLAPAQIVELGALVGFWKMYNTIHDCLHIPIEQHLLARSETVAVGKAA